MTVSHRVGLFIVSCGVNVYFLIRKDLKLDISDQSLQGIHK